ncbi:hypothetical protein CHARACLAT_018927 [Characodon lateralis]|uniref:Uncharacterized protein n=1 Tax=Characodon lateralis TaxID=208331 RepID=A0ABU7DSB9_9TELE|nr:hypothetical protein [Characodon lateralis]
MQAPSEQSLNEEEELPSFLCTSGCLQVISGTISGPNSSSKRTLITSKQSLVLLVFWWCWGCVIGSDYFHAGSTGQRWFECDASILKVMTRVCVCVCVCGNVSPQLSS